MALIADILLVAGALGAAFYCVVLSRRLNQFRKLESGVGGAIAELSLQVSELTGALDRAKSEAQLSSSSLENSAARAETAAHRLESLLSSLQDLPKDPKDVVAKQNPTEQPKFRRRLAGRNMMETKQ